MNRDKVLKSINENNRLDLIYDYCIEKGKNILQVSQFVATIVLNPYMIDRCFNYALIYYTMKYDIILLHDKKGKFIKAF